MTIHSQKNKGSSRNMNRTNQPTPLKIGDTQNRESTKSKIRTVKKTQKDPRKNLNKKKKKKTKPTQYIRLRSLEVIRVTRFL